MTNEDLPRWMITANDNNLVCSGKRKKIRLGFLEKTLNSFINVLEEEFMVNKTSSLEGLYQGINSRIKIFSTLLLIGVACMLRSPIVLFAMSLWTIYLAYLSAIDCKNFLKRVWIVIPLFSGFVVLPSILNIVVPGHNLLVLYEFKGLHQFGPIFFPQVLAITYEGLRVASVLIIRVSTCVSLALLLTLTTPRSSLLKGLSGIKIPVVFISILEMSVVYIFILINTARNILVARKSRNVGYVSARSNQRFVGTAIGTVFIKTITMGEKIHSAMISRGYTGQPQTLTVDKLNKFDVFWFLFTLSISILFLGGEMILE